MQEQPAEVNTVLIKKYEKNSFSVFNCDINYNLSRNKTNKKKRIRNIKYLSGKKN